MTYDRKICEQDAYDPAERLESLRKLKTILPNRDFFIHYKGGIYMTVGEGKHTEREWETLVAYTHIWPHHDSRWWFRPYEMFHGTVDVGVMTEKHGIIVGPVPRFMKVDFASV